MEGKTNIRKKIIYGLLLLSWMSIIVYFSSMPAGESAKASSEVTDMVLGIVQRTGLISPGDIDPDLYSGIHGIIRMLAHFVEYYILGVLSYLFFLQFRGKKIKNVIAVSLIFCVLFAISDEIHQYFVPGRASQITDVIIDTAGSISGIISVRFLRKIIKL